MSASRGSYHSIAPGAARRGRHYLIDARFQLKYTALLVGVVVSVMVVLGVVIARIGAASAENATYAAVQAEKALVESQTSSRVVRQSSLQAAADNPELLKLIEEETAVADAEALKNLTEVRARRAKADEDRRDLNRVLGIGALVLVVLLSLMGVLITHRIVGPVFKIKRLLRQVGTGRLVVKERLRRGDELGDLFETFLQMTYSLKARDLERLATLNSAIGEARRAHAPEQVLSSLDELRAQLSLGLGREEAKSIPPPME